MKARQIAWLMPAALAISCGMIHPRPQPGMVAGVVRGAPHHPAPTPASPVVGRQITMLSHNGAIYTRTRTDVDGKFSFVVPPGKYTVWGGESPQEVEVRSGEISALDITAPER
jgi:hypothetical protein